MELVSVKNGVAFCDSSLVAKRFGIPHFSVSKTIEKLLEKLRAIDNCPKVEVIEKEYRGQTFTAYLMDREFFTLLCMRFENKKALEWQVKFNNAFYEMEERILSNLKNIGDNNFLETRHQSKLARREETDIIKDFVEYAISQGSKSANYYYKHLTNATYKALELIILKEPKLRDTLSIYELAELMLAERLVRHKLKEYMALGRNYKDIYESVKKDLQDFGKTVRLSDIETVKELK